MALIDRELQTRRVLQVTYIDEFLEFCLKSSILSIAYAGPAFIILGSLLVTAAITTIAGKLS